MPPSFLRLVLELPEVLLPRGEFAHDLVARWVAVEDAEAVNVSTCEREEEQRGGGVSRALDLRLRYAIDQIEGMFRGEQRHAMRIHAPRLPLAGFHSFS